jgi:hypothetical protein
MSSRSPEGSWKDPIRRFLGTMRPSGRALRLIAVGLVVATMAGATAAAIAHRSSGPEDAVVAFYDDLDFRRFEDAWERLDPGTRPALAEYLVDLSVSDGLLASYASLDTLDVVDISIDGDRASVEIELAYVTAVAEHRSVETVDLVRREGRWGIILPEEVATEPAERLARRTSVDFHPMGRRTATADTTEYDDVLDRPELELAGTRVVYVDGRPAAVGMVHNTDADPAAVTVTTQLVDGAGEVVASYNAATVIEHSLLPGESTPFRIDFEGVAGRDDAGSFHPDAFVPIGPIADLAGMTTYASAVVTGRGLERPVVLQDLAVTVDASGVPQLHGSMLNLGTTDTTVVTLLVSLYDHDGTLIWVDWVVVPDAARPGSEVSFAAALTARHRLSPVATATATYANGLAQPTTPAAGRPLLTMPDESGYTGLSVRPVVFLRSAS